MYGKGNLMKQCLTKIGIVVFVVKELLDLRKISVLSYQRQNEKYWRRNLNKFKS